MTDKQTNADRIRAMSDEEMAEALYHLEGGRYCQNLRECIESVDLDKEIPDDKCIKCVLRWLREEG